MTPEIRYAVIHVVDGPTASWPVVERVPGGWQSGAHHYPDADVLDVTPLRLAPPGTVVVPTPAESLVRYPIPEQAMSLPPPPGRLLDDGHVEWTHDCKGERVVATLPMPPWSVVGGRVEPSVHCTACGMHGWVLIEPDSGADLGGGQR